jgi:hypothetical protein
MSTRTATASPPTSAFSILVSLLFCANVIAAVLVNWADAPEKVFAATNLSAFLLWINPLVGLGYAVCEVATYALALSNDGPIRVVAAAFGIAAAVMRAFAR